MKEIVRHVINNEWMLGIIVILSMIGYDLILSVVRDSLQVQLGRVIGRRRVEFIHNKLTFIGVIHHELSHVLFAILTFAKVSNINLFRVDKRKGTLGTVEIETRGHIVVRAIQMTFCGLAPLLCGSISLYLIWHMGIEKEGIELLEKALYWYLIISIEMHMTLSKEDRSHINISILLIYILEVIIIHFSKFNIYSYIKFTNVISYIICIEVLCTVTCYLLSRIRWIRHAAILNDIKKYKKEKN